MAKGDNETKGSRSIRALEILEAVVNTGQSATMSEIAAATALPRASLHRIVSLLEKEGFLRNGPRGRGYEQGPRLGRLARSALATTAETGYRHSVLTALSKKIGETCNISVPDGDAMIYRDRVETEWPLRHGLPIGTRVPLHCTAGGKLYLSHMTPSQQKRLLAMLTLERHTDKTLTDAQDLLADLEAVKRNGYSTDNEEFIEGMIAIAVPVVDAENRMIAALAFHAPLVRMDLKTAHEALPELRAAAEALSYGNDNGG